MRREFPARVKIAAFERCGGRCEECTAKLGPGNVEYDHAIPDGLTGSPTLDNCRVLCRSCHREKTAKDIGAISKAKRRQRQHIGIRKPRSIRAWRRFDGTPVYASRER